MPNSTESSYCTSTTASARAERRSSRAFSRSSSAMRLSRGSRGTRLEPRCWLVRGAFSTCDVAAEASRRTRCLYSAVNRCRLARSTASDDARLSGGAAAGRRSLCGLAALAARAGDVKPPELRNNVTLFDFFISDFQPDPVHESRRGSMSHARWHRGCRESKPSGTVPRAFVGARSQTVRPTPERAEERADLRVTQGFCNLCRGRSGA
jgi:hypothetical protein